MTAVKRRTIWLNDREWDRLGARAAREGVNISNLIRVWAGELMSPTEARDTFGHSSAAPKPKRTK